MNAIEALLSRVSVAKLSEPGPDAEVMDTLLRAALRAPDHGVLRPWRFLVLSGEQRHRLGDLIVAARQAREPDCSEEELAKTRSKPLRAPVILVVVAEVIEGDRVPVIEQVMAVSAAAQNVMLAAHALGVGAMWRTGWPASDTSVKEGLGFSAKDEIVGFIYLGTPSGSIKAVPHEDPQTYLRELP